MKNRSIYLVLFFIILIVFVLWFYQQRNVSNKTVLNSIPAVGQRTKDHGCEVQGPMQDKQCTPGAIIPTATAEQICARGYAKSVRNVPVAVKHEVYREYGVGHHEPGEYEVDHLISLELGGSNDIANPWPETAEPRPGFHEKDKVENYLHKEVCEGKIQLQEAQREIANNWLEIYNRM